MRPSAVLLVVGLLLALPTFAVAGAGPAPAPTLDIGTQPAPSSGNGTLVLQVTPATASVTVNGSSISLGPSGNATLSLAPGPYYVVVTAPGDREFEGNVTVVDGTPAYLTVTLPPTPGPAGSPGLSLGNFPVAVTATVVGVAAIVVLGVLLLRTPPSRPERAASPPTPPGPDEGPE
jgi:hypothetical protein